MDKGEPFRYARALRAGPPRHAPGDAFLMRHPRMERAQRAKIFAPFDALRGFGDSISDAEAAALREAENPFADEWMDQEGEWNVCCRYYIERDDPEIRDILTGVNRSPLAERFLQAGDAVLTDGEIHPTAVVPTLASGRDGKPCVFPMKWGFTIPGVRPVFNARVETASIKQSFRNAWEAHRCIVPASYYFEWRHERTPGGKLRTMEKYAIQPAGGSAAYLCGLYRLEDNLPHFVILTREPTEDLARIHDRMPLLLPRKYILDWINPLTAPDKMLPLAFTDLVMAREGKKE